MANTPTREQEQAVDDFLFMKRVEQLLSGPAGHLVPGASVQEQIDNAEALIEAADKETAGYEIHESPIDWEYVMDRTPPGPKGLWGIHTALRVRALDIAAAINPDDVDPVLAARYDEVSYLKKQVEACLDHIREEAH